MIKTNDGQTLKSTEPEDIVRELNDMSFSPEPTPGKFMTESAGRILAFFGTKVRHDTAENYVADLFTYGLLTTEEGPVKADA